MTCRIVVGADGRQSTVRKGLGLEMAYQESAYLLGGLLVQGDGLPDPAVQGTEGDTYFLVFPRREGVTRLYVGCAPRPGHQGSRPGGTVPRALPPGLPALWRRHRRLGASGTVCVPPRVGLLDRSTARRGRRAHRRRGRLDGSVDRRGAQHGRARRPDGVRGARGGRLVRRCVRALLPRASRAVTPTPARRAGHHGAALHLHAGGPCSS